jgi:hypothetical protein
MRRLLSVAAVGIVAVTALVMTGCTSVTGGAPTGVTLTMATDSTVEVTWNAPTEGSPDKYYVAFMATDASAYTDFDTVTLTSVEHNPIGKTGKYKVTAVFGKETFDAATTPSSAPIHTAATEVSELNASGSSGYGWGRTGGDGGTFSMKSAANAGSVDFYVSDWAATSNGDPYFLISPDLGPTDPGNVVPTGSWRLNGLAGPVTEQGPLPAHVTGNYFSQQELTQYPFFCAVYTADGYFGLVTVTDYNPSAGTVKVESWFQVIKGLRLIQH